MRGADDIVSWLDAIPSLDSVQAFSAVREAMTGISDARVVLGGKMGLLNDPGDLYEGAMPGVVEETLLALEADLPCVPLGAFGGAARDVAIALDLLDAAQRVPRSEQSPSYAPSLDRVAAYRDKIPVDLKPDLASLANDDRGEPMAYAIADLLERWLA